jgi:hypothetical protein
MQLVVGRHGMMYGTVCDIIMRGMTAMWSSAA